MFMQIFQMYIKLKRYLISKKRVYRSAKRPIDAQTIKHIGKINIRK